MSVQRTIVGTIAVPLLLAALTSCGGGDDSVADPPVSSAPTSSPTESPQRESPEHFIRRWADTEREMQNTGDTSAYLSLSGECRACRILAKTVQRYYADGGFIRWGGWSIRSIRHYPSSGRGTSFAVRSVSAPTTYRTSSGAPIRHLKGGLITYVLTVAVAADTMTVTAKAQLSG